MKKGQKALNNIEIRKKSIRFILSLTVLSLYSFICIIFLYETKAIKDGIVLEKINAYNLISDKDAILTNKLESIYDKMTQTIFADYIITISNFINNIFP